MNKLKLAVFLSSAIFAGCVSADQAITHPNLRDAYQACNNSIRHIQQAHENNNNNGVFGGHAVKAEELLQQAKHEIELADEYRNDHAR
jgi:starvation-inducible outer membrane lipoprotein